MPTIIRPKASGSAPRLPSRPATRGTAKQPRMVKAATVMEETEQDD
ncbi:hypothetical protein [Streptomyces sp. TLI_185]|nr:hypothetical protein [Streptomyces sp. TLI_185]